MALFSKKTWLNRISEYPNRRILTDTTSGTASTVTVARSEGTISQDGDAFSATNMNDLETRIDTAFTDGLGGCTVYKSEGHYYITDGSDPKKLGSSEGTATTSQVLSGATFNSANTPDSDDYSTGTMANNGAVVQALDTANTSYKIAEGYHNGSGEIYITNQEKTVNPTTVSQTVSPDSGKVLSKVTVGAIATQTKTSVPSTAEQTIYPDTGAYLSNVNVKAVDVSLPSASTILTGNTASVTSNGTTLGTVSGSMTNNGAVKKTYTANASDQAYTIPKGYHNGSGVVTFKGVSVALPGDWQILNGCVASAYSNGTSLGSVTGAMPNYGSQQVGGIYSLTSGGTNDGNWTSFKMPATGYYDTNSSLGIANSALKSLNPYIVPASWTGAASDTSSKNPSFTVTTAGVYLVFSNELRTYTSENRAATATHYKNGTDITGLRIYAQDHYNSSPVVYGRGYATLSIARCSVGDVLSAYIRDATNQQDLETVGTYFLLLS